MSNKSKGNSGKSRRRTAEDKLRIVLAAVHLSGEQLGELLRREGVQEVDLREWQERVLTAGVESLKDSKRKKSETTPEARELREVKRELHRKEKALAEAAALLVLKKKWHAYLEERDDGMNTRSET